MPKDTSSSTKPTAGAKKASKSTPIPTTKPSKTPKQPVPSTSSSSKPKPTEDFDIDSIFAAPSASTSALPPPAATTASKKKKKAKKPSAATEEEEPKKAKEVEVSRVQTVVDPSIGVGKKVEAPAGGVGEMDGDMEAFRNSRGSGKSTGRKTEEGFSIYKEDNLGINDDEGGDTDLCPFDCQCCY
ncbi:hypothetical protein BDY24DRAFT_382183 [Mrakia frigida]|uniref:DUF1764 domain-containing protein n=1 Tax=Mrakia frigida TaxID=29902 RepID=UPI003FCBFC69